MHFDLWPQAFLSSISLAAVLMPVALSWVVIFRTTQVLMFAVGEFALLGAYIFYTANHTHHVNWWLSLIVAMVSAAIIGALVFLSVMRRLLGRPHWIPVIVTMGLAFIADAVMDLIWGNAPRQVATPADPHVYRVATNATFNTADMYATVIGVVLFVLTLVFFRYSSLGTRMRASAELPILAAQSGVRVVMMFATGWALACGLAAAGGVSLTMTTILDPTGITIGVLALTPVLLGGLDSIVGVLVGSVVTAVVSNLSVLYLGADSIDAVAGVMLLLVLLVRPYGLFGTKAIVRV